MSAFFFWAIGYEGLWPHPVRRYVYAVTLLAWYALHLIVLIEVLFPVYVPRPAPRAHCPIATVDGKIILHSAYVEPGYAEPGETVTVRLVWEALEPIRGNYAVFVHALEPHGDVVVAQEDTYPLYGNYPTMLRVPRQPFEEIHRLRMPNALDIPYVRLTVGMYRYETMERLPAFAPDGTRFQ
ncbi:hypothetical protein, partial [Thermogutta sp.]|uniref:hypothetical protein n=1 Tax=Thermogutta sp. TaxID=1962930 RepID=UPI0032209D9F